MRSAFRLFGACSARHFLHENPFDHVGHAAVFRFGDRLDLGEQFGRQAQADLFRGSDVSGHAGKIIFRPPLANPGTAHMCSGKPG